MINEKNFNLSSFLTDDIIFWWTISFYGGRYFAVWRTKYNIVRQTMKTRGPIWIETDKNGFSVIVVYLTNRPIYPPIFIRLYIRIGYIRINWSILYEFVKYTTITEIRFYPFLSVSDL